MSGIEPYGRPTQQTGPPVGWTGPPLHHPPAAVNVPSQPVAVGTVGYQGFATDQRPPGTAVVTIAWIAAVLTLGYMLPWAIAATRGRSNQAAIGIIDLLLGWTFVGWVVSLVMACQAHQAVGPVSHAAMFVGPTIHTSPPPPAGWYPSPSGPGQQYWDGLRWTEHRSS